MRSMVIAMDDITQFRPNPDLRLLDQVREVMRPKGQSIIPLPVT